MPNQDQPVVSPPPPVVSTEGADTPPPPMITASDSLPVEKPPLNPPPLDISPVVVTGSSKRNTGKKAFVATILGLIILVGGVAAGLFLTRQKQDIREKAYTDLPLEGSVKIHCNNNDFNLITLKAKSEDPICARFDNEAVCRAAKNKQQVKNYKAIYTIGFSGSRSAVNLKYVIRTDFCTSGCSSIGSAFGSCGENNVDTEYPLTINNNEVKTIEVYSPSPFNENCGSVQTDVWISAIENCSNPQINGKPYDFTPSNASSYSWAACNSGIDCPILPPTATPTTTPAAISCQDVRVYRVEGVITDPAIWTRLTATDLQNLEAGDEIYLAVVGQSDSAETNGGFDKAKFSVNGVARPEVTTFKPKGAEDAADTYIIYDVYTVPGGTTTFNISAQIHHSSGWY